VLSRFWLLGLALFVFSGPASAHPLTDRPAEVPTWGAAWTFERYRDAMRASNRKVNIDAAGFAAIQQRRGMVQTALERYLVWRFGKADPAVLRAFQEMPREYFHYHYQNDASFAAAAYEATARPWAIGYGSALSDYLGQSYMTQLAQVTPDSTVLEIGTGSGYQIGYLARLAKRAYSIEIIEPLGKATAGMFEPIGFTNVATRVSDGFYGWPEVEGGFDVIMVTCVAQYVPPALFEQLKPGGRLIIPIGQPFRQGQILYVYTKEADGRITSRRDVGVYFIPMTGRMFTPPAVRPAAPAPAPAPAPAAAPPPVAAPAPAAPSEPTPATLRLPPARPGATMEPR